MRPSIGGELKVHFGDVLLDRLRKRAASKGVTVSEVIRQGLDAWLNRQEKEENQ